MNISLGPNLLVLQDDGTYLQQIRALPSRTWHKDTNSWTCPYVREVYDAMVKAKFPVQHIPRPDKSGYEIDLTPDKKCFIVRTLATTSDVQLCRKIPEYRSFNSQQNAWLCRVTRRNVEYLKSAFPQAVWSAQSLAERKQYEGAPQKPQSAGSYAHLLGRQRSTVSLDQPVDHKFYTKPFPHQLGAFLQCREHPAFALFMEQRTGKTHVAANKVKHLYQKGEITGFFVVCPNGVKDTWDEELRTHIGDVPMDMFIWEAKTRHKAKDWVLSKPRGAKPLRVLIMNIDALSGLGAEIAELFMSTHYVFMAVDESTMIKSPSAKRTKKCWKLGKHKGCRHRMIMTGTPVTQGPLDLFAQFKFLDPSILGFSSMTSFRDRYAVMGGWQNRQIMGYVNLEELVAKIEPYSFRITRNECTDMPPKVHQKRSVELSKEQRQYYNQMRDEMLLEYQGHKNVVQFAIVQCQILQRIIGGFFPIKRLNEETDEEESLLQTIPGPNPKLNELLEIVDELQGEKFIIWARYKAELRMIVHALKKHYGEDSVVEFHGDIDKAGRKEARQRFQGTIDQEADPRVRFFVGQVQAGGKGLPLHSAGVVVYFSNTFSYEDRIQSEDRAQHLLKGKYTTYIDLVAKNTMDTRLIGALRTKKGLADVVTGDPSFAWL